VLWVTGSDPGRPLVEWLQRFGKGSDPTGTATNLSTATVHCITTSRSTNLRRPVSPVIHSRTRRFFLTLARRECQLQERDAGAFAATAGLVAQPQEGPSQGPPREPCGLSGPHGPGVAFRHPRSAISVPGPHFEIRHSPAAPHGRLNVGRLIRSTEAATTHDIAAARATAIGPGLLDLSPPTEGLLPGAGRCRVRCWIQTPRRWQRQAHDRHTREQRG
jgi:hypothetical protein